MMPRSTPCPQNHPLASAGLSARPRLRWPQPFINSAERGRGGVCDTRVPVPSEAVGAGAERGRMGTGCRGARQDGVGGFSRPSGAVLVAAPVWSSVCARRAVLVPPCCGGVWGYVEGAPSRRVPCGAPCELWSGGVLLSHTLPSAVPLPCWVLASGFGMGPGVSPRP